MCVSVSVCVCVCVCVRQRRRLGRALNTEHTSPAKSSESNLVLASLKTPKAPFTPTFYLIM